MYSKPCPICSATQPSAALRKFKVKWRLPSGQWLTKVVIGRTLAEKVEAKFRAMAIEEGVLGVVHSPSLSAVWKSFHESKRTVKRSIRDDAQRFRDWLEGPLGDVKLDRITPTMVEAVVHDMVRQGKAPATQVRVLALLRTVFNWAIRRGLCKGDNPTKRIDWPTVDNVRTRVLTPEEVDRFLATLNEWPDRTAALLMRFLLFTGLRRGQTIRMEWDWIDWDRGVVSFPSGSTKNGKGQAVPLSTEALEILRQSRLNWKKAGVVSPLVFPSSVGTPYKEVTKVFQKVAKKAGIVGARLHDLRRSFRSWAVSNGVDLYTVSKLLGHSSTAITQRIYIGVYDEPRSRRTISQERYSPRTPGEEVQGKVANQMGTGVP